MSHVVSFVYTDFLHVAGINKTCRQAWGFRDQLTSYTDKSTTATQLQVCFDSGLLVSVTVCEIAAKKGLHQVLRAAVYHGCPLGDSVCAAAASNGNLLALQTARELGSPWCRETFVSAAANGHLEVIQWCVQHGVPVSDLALLAAKSNRQRHVEQWIIENMPSLAFNPVSHSVMHDLHLRIHTTNSPGALKRYTFFGLFEVARL